MTSNTSDVRGPNSDPSPRARRVTDTNVIIRSATSADTGLLVDLGRRTFVGAFGTDNDPGYIADYVDSAFTSARLEKELADAAAQFFIAERDGVAVGYAKIRRGAPPACVHGNAPFEIERIYAEQSVIGTGVGSALIAECLEAIRKRGGVTVWLGVWERNERAIRFYERFGFKTVGEKSFVLGGETQRDVVMSRRLTV